MVQRRLFREYVEAAICTAVKGMVCRRRGGLVSADIALVRSDGFVRRLGLHHQDFQYGREDVGPYEPRALSPARPYGVPVASASCVSYWLDGVVVGSDEGEDVGDDAWIAPWSTLMCVLECRHKWVVCGGEGVVRQAVSFSRCMWMGSDATRRDGSGNHEDA